MNAAYTAFSWSNPSHHGLWPSLNQYESEVIAVTALMVNGGKKDICGATTSGGTESIILAIKAHREHYGIKQSIQYPELTCGPTAHAAVDKARELMNIRKVVVKDSEGDFCLNPRATERLITSNTILIYSSASNYQQGVADPIEELSKISLKYKIGLHVDACSGGFILPFAKKLGCAFLPFDFSNDGVTSMSLDTHEYVYAGKETSVVLYRYNKFSTSPTRIGRAVSMQLPLLLDPDQEHCWHMRGRRLFQLAKRLPAGTIQVYLTRFAKYCRWNCENEGRLCSW